MRRWGRVLAGSGAFALWVGAFFLWGEVSASGAEATSRPGAVDLREAVIWGAECVLQDGSGLAFGGNEQAAEDGCSHTRIKEGDAWKGIVADLRARNALQKYSARTWELRGKLKGVAARTRSLYFTGLAAVEEQKAVGGSVSPALQAVQTDLKALTGELGGLKGLGEYEAGQVKVALDALAAAADGLKTAAKAAGQSVTGDVVKNLSAVQVQLERVSEMLDAEPAPRALSPLVYDEKAKVFVLFGGDHLDYLTNDTWVFDPAKKKWMQRHPESAPPPRANHQLAAAEGTVTLTGGYGYTSSVGYCAAQYRDLNDGEWTYDLAANTWTGSNPKKKAVPPDGRAYRRGPFHPEFFLQGEKPSAMAVEEKLKTLPANTWVLMKPPYVPRQNRDWGTAAMDPDHDELLYWSGGHSAHGGSDVLHYHLSTNRWELPFPVEFPLGQLYSNTSYPAGFNFNQRPWVTGHTYQNYTYDTTAKRLLFTGHRKQCYVYDPEAGDWVGRIAKPGEMSYGACFYDLTLCQTPRGAVCWTNEGLLFRFDAAANAWQALMVTGKPPGSVVDNSCMVYDSKRNRLVFFVTGYGGKYGGQAHVVDLKTLAGSQLTPKNLGGVAAISLLGGFGIDRACYEPEADVVLFGALIPPGADGFQRTPALDLAGNRWISLGLQYETGDAGGGKKQALTPRGHSSGMVYDARRKLVWGVDANCAVYVLKLDVKAAAVKDLAAEEGPEGR